MAGVYDYWLGGGMNLLADRQLGDAIGAESALVPVHVRAAKSFHLRVVRYCALRGTERFIRTGAVTWVPKGRNVHHAARAVTPEARVVYVNDDEEAHDWARELLADGHGVTAVLADAGRPEEVLGAPPVAALLAPAEPVCLIIGMLLHFVPADQAAAVTAAYAKALPPGSAVAVSVALPDCSPQADRLMAMFTPATVYRHTVDDVASWLEDAGLEIVPPGVVDVRLVPGESWAAEELHPRAPGFTVGALGLVS